MARLRHHLKNAFIPHHGNDYQPHALRRPWLHTYAGIVVGIKIIAVLVASIYASPARVSDITPATITQLTNAQRAQKKIATLTTNPLLTKAAEKKASDMAQRSYFAHISPSGVTPWYWFKQAGYSYTYAGENLAIDFVSGEDVITAWMNSPSHRSNLLSAKYKDIGVAVRTATIDGAQSLIVVQMFGAPVKKTTKTVTVPAQQPIAAKVKAVTAAAPVPPTKVLGEAAQDVPVSAPTILTPLSGSLVRTTKPEIVGQTEPGAVVTLFVQGVRSATVTASDNGAYSIIPDTELSQGSTTFQVSATVNGKTSQLSSAATVVVDTEPPSVDVGRSVVLPSYLDDHSYTVAVAVTGQPKDVRIGTYQQTVPVTASGETYIGAVRVSPQSIPGPILVQADDAAGNQISSVLADPSIFTTGVVASSEGPLVNGIKLVFYSRTFLFLLILFLTVAAVLNVVIEWRHQHQPMIVHSLLVLFLATTLLVL